MFIGCQPLCASSMKVNTLPLIYNWKCCNLNNWALTYMGFSKFNCMFVHDHNQVYIAFKKHLSSKFFSSYLHIINRIKCSYLIHPCPHNIRILTFRRCNQFYYVVVNLLSIFPSYLLAFLATTSGQSNDLALKPLSFPSKHSTSWVSLIISRLIGA